MKKILLSAVALCAFALSASEFRQIFKVNSKNPTALKNFSVYNHAGHASKFSMTEIDSVSAIKLQVTESLDQWYTRIQLRLKSNVAISACTEYRIKFRCRADRPARFRIYCQEGVSPWAAITEHKPGMVMATSEWQDVEYTFTATKDVKGEAWLPNFECGVLGKDNSLYIADLVVEALDGEKNVVIAKPDPQKMQLYCQTGFKAQKKNSTFNGSNVCGIYMEAVPAQVRNQSQVQFRFPMTVNVVKGASYRLSFYHKADRAASCLAQIQRATHPWSMISPQSVMKFNTGTEWEYFEMNFTAAENYNKALFLPNIGLGLIGKDNTFYLRDVKFEKVD